MDSGWGMERAEVEGGKSDSNRKIEGVRNDGQMKTNKKGRERDLLMFTLCNQYLSASPLLLQKALVSVLWCPLLTGVELHRSQSMPVIITIYRRPSTHKRNSTSPPLYEIWRWKRQHTGSHMFTVFTWKTINSWELLSYDFLTSPGCRFLLTAVSNVKILSRMFIKMHFLAFLAGSRNNMVHISFIDPQATTSKVITSEYTSMLH